MIGFQMLILLNILSNSEAESLESASAVHEESNLDAALPRHGSFIINPHSLSIFDLKIVPLRLETPLKELTIAKGDCYLWAVSDDL
jgi:hypothetical protein